jgi:hypothetical protein
VVIWAARPDLAAPPTNFLRSGAFIAHGRSDCVEDFGRTLAANEAGKAATLYYEHQGVKKQREPGGLLYEDQNGIFSYQRAIWGPPMNDNGGQVDPNMYLPVPNGTGEVGEYHDHVFIGDSHSFDGDLSNPPQPTPEYVADPAGLVFKIFGQDDLGFRRICVLVGNQWEGIDNCQ